MTTVINSYNPFSDAYTGVNYTYTSVEAFSTLGDAAATIDSSYPKGKLYNINFTSNGKYYSGLRTAKIPSGSKRKWAAELDIQVTETNSSYQIKYRPYMYKSGGDTEIHKNTGVYVYVCENKSLETRDNWKCFYNNKTLTTRFEINKNPTHLDLSSDNYTSGTYVTLASISKTNAQQTYNLSFFETIGKDKKVSGAYAPIPDSGWRGQGEITTVKFSIPRFSNKINFHCLGDDTVAFSTDAENGKEIILSVQLTMSYMISGKKLLGFATTKTATSPNYTLTGVNKVTVTTSSSSTIDLYPIYANDIFISQPEGVKAYRAAKDELNAPVVNTSDKIYVEFIPKIQYGKNMTATITCQNDINSTDKQTKTITNLIPNTTNYVFFDGVNIEGIHTATISISYSAKPSEYDGDMLTLDPPYIAKISKEKYIWDGFMTVDNVPNFGIGCMASEQSSIKNGRLDIAMNTYFNNNSLVKIKDYKITWASKISAGSNNTQITEISDEGFIPIAVVGWGFNQNGTNNGITYAKLSVATIDGNNLKTVIRSQGGSIESSGTNGDTIWLDVKVLYINNLVYRL